MTSDLATALVDVGWDVHVVTSRQRIDDPKADLLSFERWRGISIHRLSGTRWGRMNLMGRGLDYLSFYRRARAALAGQLRTGDTVIFMTDPPLLASMCRSAVPLGVRTVVWHQDLFPDVAFALGLLSETSWIGRFVARVRDTGLLAADAHVAVSPTMARNVVAYGVDQLRVHEIHNWALAESSPSANGLAGDAPATCSVPLGGTATDANRSRAELTGAAWVDTDPCSGGEVDKAQTALRTELGLDGQIVIGYSGNFGRVHEFETILEAATRLRSSHTLRFLMIGGGARHGAFAEAVAARALDNVHFVPPQPLERLSASLASIDVHLVSLLPAADGLVMPSKFYGIAAQGGATIAIADPQGDLAAIIRAGECGVCVAPGNVAQLVENIEQLAADDVRRRRLGENARTHYLAHYAKAHAVAAWHALLSEDGR